MLTGLAAGVAEGFVVGVPLFLLAMVVLVFVQVRYFQLAPAVLVLERSGVRRRAAPGAARSAGGSSGGSSASSC